MHRAISRIGPTRLGASLASRPHPTLLSNIFHPRRPQFPTTSSPPFVLPHRNAYSTDRLDVPHLTASVPAFPINPHAYTHTFASTALQHRTFTLPGNVDLSHGHNETLEWFGDTVLCKALSIMMLRLFPAADEGALTLVRNCIENNAMLARVCHALGLHARMRAGSREQYESPTVLAGVLEAYFGGVWLDVEGSEGVGSAEEKVLKWVEELFAPYAVFYMEIYKEKSAEEAKKIASQHVVVDKGAAATQVPVLEEHMPQEATPEDLADPALPEYTTYAHEHLNIPPSAFTAHTFHGKTYYTITTTVPDRDGFPKQVTIEGPLASKKSLAKHLASRALWYLHKYQPTGALSPLKRGDRLLVPTPPSLPSLPTSSYPVPDPPKPYPARPLPANEPPADPFLPRYTEALFAASLVAPDSYRAFALPDGRWVYTALVGPPGTRGGRKVVVEGPPRRRKSVAKHECSREACKRVGLEVDVGASKGAEGERAESKDK